MLLQAMNAYTLASREHSEQAKAQYTDKGPIKDYFRASELGQGDRKILYGFYKHQIPTIARSVKSVRQLSNGDSMHARYQKWWEDMGVLISMEERLSSKDDEYLAQFEWEWAGHYDGCLDINVLRAHALGLCKIGSVQNPDTNEWDVEVDIDDDYAAQIGIFEEGYEPLKMVADLKTMNPWGFKRVAQGDISELRGYIDQITFYMYMLNTPYGSIYIEDKGTNDIVEVQVLWHDMHEGVAYAFDPTIHGEPAEGVLRVVVDSERFFGSDTALGVVARVNQLWETKKLLDEAYAQGGDLSQVMPPRCSEDPSQFPCSWGGGKEKCEYFNHCWNQYTNGNAITAFEACPEELKWEIVDNNGEIHVIDSRKVPNGVAKEALQGLVAMNAIVITQFLVDDVDAAPPIESVADTALNADAVLNSSGELNLGAPAGATATPAANTVAPNPSPDAVKSNVTVFPGATPGNADPAPVNTTPAADQKVATTPGTLKGVKSQATLANKPDTANSALPNVAVEYINQAHQKSIKCLNCTKEVSYQKLANGGTKKCEFCGHVNKVLRPN